MDTTLLAKHEGRAHKMAFDPGSQRVFYSCGEDGLIHHVSLKKLNLRCFFVSQYINSFVFFQFDLRTQSPTALFRCKSIRGETVPLNAIAVDPRNPNFFAVAGSDEFARLYDIRKYNWERSDGGSSPVDFFCPPHLIGDDHVGITGLAFSNSSELLVSYNDELIYLFPKDQGLGPEADSQSQTSGTDMEYGPGPQVYSGHQNCDTVKGVNFFGPNCEYVVSGSDCGRLFIWRKKDGELLRAMEADKHVVNCIEPHPYSSVIASSGIEDDIKIWMPNEVEPAPPVNMNEVCKFWVFVYIKSSSRGRKKNLDFSAVPSEGSDWWWNCLLCTW